MNALPEAAYDEAAYLREALRKAQARVSALSVELGRTEGYLGAEVERLRRENAQLLKDLTEANGLLGDVRDERDALEAQIHGDGR